MKAHTQPELTQELIEFYLHEGRKQRSQAFTSLLTGKAVLTERMPWSEQNKARQ